MNAAAAQQHTAEAVATDLNEGHRLSQLGRFAEAEACARRVLAHLPDHAGAHNNLGYARLMQGDLAGADKAFVAALGHDPGLAVARRNRVLVAARSGNMDATIAGARRELLSPGGEQWLQNSLSRAMTEHDLTYAGNLARAGALAQRAGEPLTLAVPVNEPRRRLNTATLHHDIAQFEYLISQGILTDVLPAIIASYRTMIERREAAGKTDWEYLGAEEAALIGQTYNRILHLRDTPRIERALSTSWEPARVEDTYLSQKAGIVVIDDFLSAEALREIRAFCLESTIWLANRYAHGRHGALFHAGFNCPLTLQIAEEIRDAFPRIIGSKHTIRQMWGFKNAPVQPANSTTHADFAAVNVNFWITMDEANLSPDTGGLLIYDVDAPQHWDFHTYNGRHDIIRPFLARQGAHAVRIPYRCNRAMIFNSDLFHTTDEVHFRPDYTNRRINVTFLYGVRKDDDRRLAKVDPLTDPGHNAWRSAAMRGLGGMR